MSLVIIVLVMPSLLGQTTLAVLDFSNNSILNAQKYQSLTKGLADMMITELSRIQTVRMVERRDMKRVLDELKLAQSGVLSESQSVQVGRMLGAKNLVFGGFIVAPDNQIRIDARVVEVETGLTVKAAEVTGKSKEVLKLLGRLSQKMLNDLEIRLTKSEKKKLKSSKNIDMKAVLLYSKGIEYQENGDEERAVACFEKALNLDSDFELARERLEALR